MVDALCADAGQGLFSDGCHEYSGHTWNQHVFHILVDNCIPWKHFFCLPVWRLFPTLQGYEQTATGYQQRFPQMWNNRLNEQKAHGPYLGPASWIIATGFCSRNTFGGIKKFFLEWKSSAILLRWNAVFSFNEAIRGTWFLDNMVLFCIISLLVHRVDSPRGNHFETNLST
jgi:hypothetical protein